ncbi:HEAT repeat-containing protein 3-like [Mya arenaria]|uniref:HEAT repeat-containing protein 3-like n=1 Tax=Mya arenaria TaxID=6604 RepID=UPI0022E0829E|nr:HEAT repeat-containing protein 3-like [Mya arenaria]
MGKSKKKKFSGQKPRPTGLPSVREAEAEVELQGTSDTTPASLQAVIEKLQSPNEDNRESACTSIASFVSHPGTAQALLKLNVVKILAPLVLDGSWDIRHRALGALRNLSVDGGEEVCREMIDKDVLTPVLALVKQFPVAGQFTEKYTERMFGMVCEAYSHAFYLLLYLCEGSSVAVSQVSRDKLEPVVCTILDSEHTTMELKVAVGEFLHTVTEDNSDMRTPDLSSCVLRVMSHPVDTSLHLFLRVLASGILVNLEGSQLTSARADLVVPIVTNVAEVLAVDVAAMLVPDGTVQSEADEKQEESTSDNEAGNKLKKKGEDVENILKAQKTALEIATNLCCSDDDEWEELNSSESSNDEAMDVTGEDAGAEGMDQLCVSTEIHSAYLKCDIVSKVMKLAQPVAQEDSQHIDALSNNKQILNRFKVTQTHALLCLNNLVSSMDPEALGGADRLYTLWQGLQQMATSKSCLEQQEVLEAVTSAQRAVIGKLADVAPDRFSTVTPPDLQFMYEMCSKCQWAEVRVNALRVISTIGIILSKNTTPNPLLKDVGLCLLERVCGDGDLWVVGEALDAIFDVFSEDHLDPIVREIGLVQKLKTIAPGIKSKIHQNRKSLGEHYPLLTMARTNLVGFLKYKASH